MLGLRPPVDALWEQVISGGNVPAVMQMADPMHTRDEFYFYFRCVYE